MNRFESACGAQRRTPSRSLLLVLAALLAATLVAIPTWAEGSLFAKPAAIDSLPADDASDDPPGVLDTLNSAPVVDLGLRLSADRGWMNEASLAALDDFGLRLDELFDGAPEFFRAEGESHYQIKLEKVGPLWASFDPATDRFAVFLTHETYTGLGLDRVLAFVDGEQTVLFEEDLASLPALALTLVDQPADEPIAKSARIASLEETIDLGSARLDVRRSTPQLTASFNSPQTKAGCSHEVAPTCSAGRPVCSSGANPHFVLTALKIREDHEGFGKGNPEIELFPLNIDGVSSGSSSERSTIFQFDGRTITDFAGRSRFLPDINNENVWYSINKGASICLAQLGGQWAATLVEQDDTRGVLKVKGNDPNEVLMYLRENPNSSSNTVQVYPFNLLKFLKGVVQLVFGLFSGDGDDLFQESVGITGNLYCNDGVGQTFPRTFTLSSAEWDLQGYFACINPACGEMSASISGPTFVMAFQNAYFTANVSGGSSPFAYRWTRNGAVVGTGSSVSVSSANNYTLALRVTDAGGQVINTSRFVNVDGGMCGDYFC